MIELTQEEVAVLVLYIKDMILTVDGEWGACRDSADIPSENYLDQDMIDIYTKLMKETI